MSIVLLSLCWLLIGLFIGALAIAAKLSATTYFYHQQLSLLGIAALAALVGGWLGTWVFGSLAGTATALWVAVVAVFVVPEAIKQFTHHRPFDK